jgi:hypothetical protein
VSEREARASGARLEHPTCESLELEVTCVQKQAIRATVVFRIFGVTRCLYEKKKAVREDAVKVGNSVPVPLIRWYDQRCKRYRVLLRYRTWPKKVWRRSCRDSEALARLAKCLVSINSNASDELQLVVTI